MSNKKRLFQTLDDMNVADGENKTANVQVSNALVIANTAKGGGHVTMGVTREIIHTLMNKPDTICILLVVDRQEYNRVTNLP